MRIVCLIVACMTASGGRADILHGRAASRHQDPPISGSDSPQERPGDATPRLDDEAGVDLDQVLREAYELLDDADLGAATRALQMLVTRASKEQLAAFDARVRAARDVGLAELLAQARLDAALDAWKGHSLNLRYVTPYERAAMSGLIEHRLKRIGRARFAGRTVFEWAAEPDGYDTLLPDARAMVSDTRLAAALIGVRLRFDHALREQRDERRRLLALRADLARFAARVAAMRGFTQPADELARDPRDPAALEAGRLKRLAERGATSQPTTRPTVGDPPQEQAGPSKEEQTP